MRARGAETPPRPVPPSRTSTVWEQTVLLCCLIGSTQMTWGTIVPALPLYVDRYGVTAAMLGVIVAAFGVGRVIANIPAGLALRWWRPRPYLRTVCLLLVAVTAATGFSPDAGTLIAARVVAGVLGGAAVTIGFAVLVAGAPADRRGRVMATATAVQMSAGALGAFVKTYRDWRAGRTWPIWQGAGWFLLTTTLLSLSIPSFGLTAYSR